MISKWKQEMNFYLIFFTSIFFFPLFSTKILPCINLFFSFILSSHYLYQFPFSSMKQKLTKNRIRFSDPTTTMLKHYFASFLCLHVLFYHNHLNGHLFYIINVILEWINRILLLKMLITYFGLSMKNYSCKNNS